MKNFIKVISLIGGFINLLNVVSCVTIDNNPSSAKNISTGNSLPKPVIEQKLPAFKRPVLTADQAARFTPANVLRYKGSVYEMIDDPWDPEADTFIKGSASIEPDYRVDPSKGDVSDTDKIFTTIQEAVNHASLEAEKAGQGSRIYIEIAPGTYNEILYVPRIINGDAGITLYSQDNDPSKTVIAYAISADMTSSQYREAFYSIYSDTADNIENSNPRNIHPGIWAMYFYRAKRKSSIGTTGSDMVQVKNNGFQAKNISFINTFNERKYGPSQAVALAVDEADRAQFKNCVFHSNQDTLYLKSANPFLLNRVFLENCLVKGDMDFIFGRATAFFKNCEIKALGERKNQTLYCLAPSTNYNKEFGFVFDECQFTSDGLGICAEGDVNLGRQWFESIKGSPYKPGTNNVTIGTSTDPKDTRSPINCPRYIYEAVGKAVILNSVIGEHINKAKPWTHWNTSGYAYRLVQYDSNDYYTFMSEALTQNKQANGGTIIEDIIPGGKPDPVKVFLGEYNNQDQ